MKPTIAIKRIYEETTKEDGYRVMVDRLWPRGIAKDDKRFDEWAKDLAPTNELRLWYAHVPERWPEFKSRYRAELKANEAVATFLETHEDKKRITLVYAAKDVEHAHALVLQQYLQKLIGK
jgi:uncharacterized protein YeaO (DUF488 family)